jgi:hypothetical protein
MSAMHTAPGAPVPEASTSGGHETASWHWTLWLTGVDYFSSLGYAPYLAVAAAGYLAPIATVLLLLVTVFCAVPTYAMVARHSHEGEGSIRMIERLTAKWGRLGWIGKMLVLVLIGFAMTDFVLTITISAADAAQHVLQNPYVIGQAAGLRHPILVSSVFVLLLGAVFWRGFKEAIGLAAAIAIPYMILNAVIIVAALLYLREHPDLVSAWWDRLRNLDPVDLRSVVARIDPEHPLHEIHLRGVGAILVLSVLVFPKLALGMSGFETGVSVMPHIRGVDLRERIYNTRKMLVAAAALMCIELLGANFVAAVAIPEEAFWRAGPDGLPPAKGRALAYLAHEHLGTLFGTIYDVSTVLILAFAGASAMAGMLNILPRYLPRFGMSPAWLEQRRPLVALITVIALVVTAAFRAEVDAQGAAYATGVLFLMASGAFAVLLAEWSKPLYRAAFVCIFVVFFYVLAGNVLERPEGIQIAGLFIVGTVSSSVASRWRRASELRVPGKRFVDERSHEVWRELQSIHDVVLVPLRSPTAEARAKSQARTIHPQRSPDTVYAFLHVSLIADTSQFLSPLRISASRAGNDFVIEVQDAVAVANAIAYVGLDLDVTVVIIGLLDQGTPLANALLYLLFGTGEVGYAVRAIYMRLRQEWLEEHAAVMRRFDRIRDRNARDAIRDMLLLEESERKEKLAEMLARAQERFAEQLPKLRRLPHLIMYE